MNKLLVYLRAAENFTAVRDARRPDPQKVADAQAALRMAQQEYWNEQDSVVQA